MSVLFDGLLDDAAVFPPGNLPLAEAVPAHQEHRRAPYAALVGAFVVAAADLDALSDATRELEGALAVSLTVPAPDAVGAALRRAAGVRGVRLVGVEVAVPAAVAPGTVVRTLDDALDDAVGDRDLRVFVELPRDERRDRLVEKLSDSPYLAKLRTGGVRADLHPGEAELAAAVTGLVAAGVPFKATAGLHHAVRSTDLATGFEQHGFLNLLAATAAARAGADCRDVADVLAQREEAAVVAAVRGADPAVRELFCSFGTCSIVDPVADLARLGLLTPAMAVTR
ncbi:MAG TPA: hypothetical protein VGE38_09580 [Nocardioides sp.]|uniref:hypothetical protein n=1 Tax=Nocardioides sp. TaxID=35761 RepID=UPI002ED7AEBE